MAVYAACGNTFGLCVDEEGCVWELGYKNVNDTSQTTKISKMPELIGITHVSVGSCHAVCIDWNGDVVTFGSNCFGQLGLGDLNDRTDPVRISSLRNIASSHCGRNHTFCINFDGGVYAFGENVNGQLGLGTFDSISIPQLLDITDVKDIECGTRFSIFLLCDSEVYISGESPGNPSSYFTSNHLNATIRKVKGLQSVQLIAAGMHHFIALTENNELYSMGLNTNGELGLGNRISRSTVSKINFPDEILKIKSICCREHESFIINEEGDVWGFGDRIPYIKADNMSGPALSPKKLSLSNIMTMSKGGSFTICKKESGEIYLFGNAISNIIQINQNNLIHELPTLYNSILRNPQASRAKSARK